MAKAPELEGDARQLSVVVLCYFSTLRLGKQR